MSNEVSKLAHGESRPVVYAKGLDKNADYDAIRDAAGGDDFAELLTDKQLTRFFPCAVLTIHLTPTTLKISAKLPKYPTKKG